MRFQNNGKGDINILQNRFTAYLSTSLRRRKSSYLCSLSRLKRHETTSDFSDIVPGASDETELCHLYQFENDDLAAALEQLLERDRYILLARVLEKQDFKFLARKLGLSYKGVSTAYYRAIHKILQEMGDERK